MSDVSHHQAYVGPIHLNTSWWYYGACSCYGYHAEKDHLEEVSYHAASDSGYGDFPDDNWDAEAPNELGSLISALVIVVAIAWALVA